MKRFMVLIIGIIFLAAGIFLFYRSVSLTKKCTKETTATVVDMKQEFDTDGDSADYMYYPILEYVVDGKTIRVTMSNGSSTPAYNINQKITVLYNPSKPKEFIVKGDKSSNVIGIIFMTLGVVISGYGIYVALKKEN